MTGKRLQILGTRGIPARHGGFETFAEYLAIFLLKNGWDVTVFCQEEGEGDPFIEHFEGVRLVKIPVKQTGALGTIIFDWKAALEAVKRESLVLTLGYNTALFCLLYRLRRVPNLINMDGLEWQREKWSFLERVWLYINERLGCLFGNRLIADHPEIKKHLDTRVSSEKTVTIPYGADEILQADVSRLKAYGLKERQYFIVIARPEPENSILDIVKAFSRKERGVELVVLGKYDAKQNEYHRHILAAASREVKFLGPIYEKEVIQALRFFALCYVHGHTVGGTNPSLVEALGAGSAVLAHDNRFNRWVAGPGAKFFIDEEECALRFDDLILNRNEINGMRDASLKRFKEAFTWDKVLPRYEKLFLEILS